MIKRNSRFYSPSLEKAVCRQKQRFLCYWSWLVEVQSNVGFHLSAKYSLRLKTGNTKLKLFSKQQTELVNQGQTEHPMRNILWAWAVLSLSTMGL